MQLTWLGDVMLIAGFVGLYVAMGRDLGFREVTPIWIAAIGMAAFFFVAMGLATGRIG